MLPLYSMHYFDRNMNTNMISYSTKGLLDDDVYFKKITSRVSQNLILKMQTSRRHETVRIQIITDTHKLMRRHPPPPLTMYIYIFIYMSYKIHLYTKIITDTYKLMRRHPPPPLTRIFDYA
jgi:hypothetical protein